MKFFRAAPALVALVVLLGTVPAFAAEASDSADAYAPETGEVLTDESVYDPVSSDNLVDDFDSNKGDVFPPVLTEPVLDDTPSTPDGDDAPVDDTPPDADGDDAPVDDIPSDADDGGFGPVLSAPDTVTVSGSDVTVYLDDRSYTSVVDVGGGEAPAVIDTPGDAPVGSGTLPGFLRAMFGEYTPKTQTVSTYFDGQLLEVSTEYVPGIAGMDMEWIASVILFGLVVFCLFRLLGGMVR